LKSLTSSTRNQEVDLVLLQRRLRDRNPAPTFQREWGGASSTCLGWHPTLLLVNHDLSPPDQRLWNTTPVPCGG
jgi:hypothetical protein